MKFVDAVLHVFYIQFASACILSESNSSKNDAFSHCRGYCKPLQYKLFQSTTLYVHLAVMQTKAFNVVNVLCLKIPFLPLCHLQIFHLVFTLLSKGGRKENKNASTSTTKGSTPPGAPRWPPVFSTPRPLPPLALSVGSSGLSCLLVHSREADGNKRCMLSFGRCSKTWPKKILRGLCCHLLPSVPECVCSGFSRQPSYTWAGCPHSVGASSPWPGRSSS